MLHGTEAAPPCASQITRVKGQLKLSLLTFSILWSVRRCTCHKYINKCNWCNWWSGTLSLHPLLVSKVRDKRTTKPTLDAGLLPGRPDMSDGSFRTNWTLEVRLIGNELAHESHQALQLFRSGCGHPLIERPRFCNFGKAGRDTYNL